jgi:hypothetical protein
MKFWILAVALGGTCLGFAQQTEKPTEKPEVLFAGQPAAVNPQAAGAAAAVTDAERAAVRITAWDLDVHLSPRQQSMEADARVTLRNDGTAPLQRIALQLSSTLNFETVGLGGKKAAFVQSTIASDADHTGKLHEAVIPLAGALAPGAQAVLDVEYGGTIALSAERLTAIGAPEATADASDWDRIAEDFTGVRGFGNVVWYPVSSKPVLLSAGAQLFTEIGRQKLMDQDATVRLRVTDEFLSAAPNVALLDGHFVKLDKPTAMPTASFPGVITASLPATRLGFETPSLFLARRSETDGHGLRVLATDADAGSAQRYVESAGMVEPLVRTWLGNKPGAMFTILDLPEGDDAPAEMGEMLATPLSSDDAAHLAPVVVHSLAHGEFSSPRAWLDEGVANFLGTLWIEANQGHTAALENLNADRPALALAEPSTPGAGPGQDLLHAANAVYYRTKAQYVLWMLRGIAGDAPLESALQQYDPARDTTPGYFEQLLEQASGKDLHWFFDDWVDHDRGLPDFSIVGVYPSREARSQVLVAVEIANEGYAEAEVPVTVTGLNGSVTDRVRVPAHGRVTHRITFQEDPTEVDVNDGTVPEVEDSIHVKKLTGP